MGSPGSHWIVSYEHNDRSLFCFFECEAFSLISAEVYTATLLGDNIMSKDAVYACVDVYPEV